MQQTPAHHHVNLGVLSLVPPAPRRIVDVGCMLGSLASAIRGTRPDTQYVGIDIDADYTEAAKAHCTETFCADIEKASDDFFRHLAPSDCWIFADCLEHLRDPWNVLRRVRATIDADGCVIVCMPNAQHWSVQQRLVTGLFRYEDIGLMDRTHIRWFTRITMIEMFLATGWQVESGLSLFANPEPPQQNDMLSKVRGFAESLGLDGDVAVADAKAYQYVFKLTPA